MDACGGAAGAGVDAHQVGHVVDQQQTRLPVLVGGRRVPSGQRVGQNAWSLRVGQIGSPMMRTWWSGWVSAKARSTPG
jgi:Zn-dependent membrane protease YugP